MFKPCEYCRGGHFLDFSGDGVEDVTIDVHGSAILVWPWDSDEPARVSVRYCPMCGRLLREEQSRLVGMTQAKNHLSAVLREANESGADIVLMRRNAPYARISPLAADERSEKDS